MNIENHIFINNAESVPWWKSDHANWNFPDYSDVEEFIKENRERADEIAFWGSEDYKLVEQRIAALSPIEQQVMAYFIHKRQFEKESQN